MHRPRCLLLQLSSSRTDKLHVSFMCICVSGATQLNNFRWNHELLGTTHKTLKWHTVTGGSRSYVNAFSKRVSPRHRIKLSTAIRSIRRLESGRVALQSAAGESEIYDHVVLATPARTSQTILGESATKAERDILSKFITTRNTCVLHSDPTVRSYPLILSVRG